MGKSWKFSLVICELLSARPHVCSALIDRFIDVRNLTIKVVHNEFEKCISTRSHENFFDIKLFLYVNNPESYEKVEINIYLTLLRACIVLISNWRSADEPSNEVQKSTSSNLNSRDAFMCLVRYLIPSAIEDLSKCNSDDAGAASAKFVGNGKRAVSVEEVRHFYIP